MARILSRTLIRNRNRNSQTLTHDPLVSPSPSLSLAYRFKSKRPEKAQLLEVDLGLSDESGSGSDMEVLGMRRLQDAIQGIVIRRSAPDWLPFIPGSSYWVPPRKRPITVVDLTGKVKKNRPMMMGLEEEEEEEEVILFSSIHGWPSSSYFIKGVLPTHSINNSPENASTVSGDESTPENGALKPDGED